MSILPPFGVSKPKIKSSKVDLPEPLLPTIAIFCPFFSCKLKLSKIFFYLHKKDTFSKLRVLKSFGIIFKL